MARADRRRAQREARNARGTRRGSGRPRGASARAVESQLFFTRLRTQAKWAFALMVIVFVVGFAFLGVGSGGLDLQSLVQDVFGAKGGGGTSISKAQKEVDKNPRDPTGYRKLATAYESKGRLTDAVNALKQYVALRPKDAAQLQHLAQLEKTQADNALSDYQLAYYASQSSNAGTTFGPPASSKLAQALNDPIASAVTSRDSTRLQQAQTAYQTASTDALATYKKLAQVQASQTAYFQLAQAAEHFGDAKTAISAYRHVLKQSSDPTTKAQVRAKIKSLRGTLPKAGG
jgi:tetratricopeptide (TPR) repeat protein